MTLPIHRRHVLGGAAATLALAAAARRARAADPMKIAFVCAGPAQGPAGPGPEEQARIALQAALGDAVATRLVGNVAPGPACAQALRDLAGGDTVLIFSTAPEFADSVRAVAREFPKLRFEQRGGSRTATNVATYDVRTYEARAVCGLIAGHLSRSASCGWLAPAPTPEIVRGVDAFAIAARKIDPRFEVRLHRLEPGAGDPDRQEAEAADALVDRGCDILCSHAGSAAVMRVAQSRGVHAFAAGTDLSWIGPAAQLTAILDHWAPYAILRAQQALAGSWKSGDTWWGFRHDLLRLAPYGPAVPPDIRIAADAVRAGIAGGALLPFAGPVRDQAGKIRIPLASNPGDGALRTMDWLAEGVAS